MPFKNKTAGTFIGLAIILSMIPASQAQAQEYNTYKTQGSGQDLGQQGEQQDYSRETLKTYVEASQNIQEVAREYQDKVAAAANDPEQMQQLQQEASRQMTRAVRETGMEVPTYNEISQQMRQDPELYERTLQIQNE